METTELAPSVQHGYSLLDVSSPYLKRFKTGSYAAAFTHETLFVSNRAQRTDATTITQTYKSVLRSSAESAAARNEVQVVSMLNEPATVNVRIGSRNYTYSAPAGIAVATMSLETDAMVSAQAVRGSTVIATVQSPDRVDASPTIQDVGYRFATSGRQLPVKP